MFRDKEMPTHPSGVQSCFKQLLFVNGKDESYNLYVKTVDGRTIRERVRPNIGHVKYQLAPEGFVKPETKVDLKPLGHPILCPECPENEQVVLWRSFTDRSLRHFLENKGQGEKLPEPLFLVERNRKRLPYNISHRPNYLWVTNQAKTSIAIGLSRILVGGEKVKLLGFSVCPHDFARGTTVVHKCEDCLIDMEKPADLRVVRHYPDYIINHITEEQIRRGVMYEIDGSFFRSLLNVDIPVSSVQTNLFKFSKLMHFLLKELAKYGGEDISIFQPTGLYKGWSSFLRPLPQETFLWTTPRSEIM